MSQELGVPDRRRHGYVELETKLENHVARIEGEIDAHTQRIEARFKKWFIVSLTAFAIIGLTSAIAIVGFGFILNEESNQNEQIQRQRGEYVLTECRATNARHRNTV